MYLGVILLDENEETNTEVEKNTGEDTNAGQPQTEPTTDETPEPSDAPVSDSSASFAAIKAEIADLKNAMGEVLELVSATKVNQSVDAEQGDDLDEWGDTLPGF